ncbi:MAG TPA: molybdopterin dinucleotide binding domain-containing protein [Desulfobaccales bacterium]|nr:molybdopterin dinucleotide binding domain-containing protein [Desulfobaccales bacterium]
MIRQRHKSLGVEILDSHPHVLELEVPDILDGLIGEVLAQVQTLSELVPENVLWINTGAASRLGIKDGETVEVISPLTTARIKAKVTDFIHPEVVFMLHGFGKTVPAQTRCYLKGASDAMLQENISDHVGGSPALDQTVVRVRPVT